MTEKDFYNLGLKLGDSLGEKKWSEGQKILRLTTEQKRLDQILKLCIDCNIAVPETLIAEFQATGKLEYYHFLAGLTHKTKEKWTATKTNKISLARSGKGDITPKLSIPWKWLQQLGCSEQDREVNLCFDGAKIILSKEEKMKKYRILDEIRKDDKEIFFGTIEDLKKFIIANIEEMKKEGTISENELEVIEDILQLNNFEEIVERMEYYNLNLFGDCCKLVVEEE